MTRHPPRAYRSASSGTPNAAFWMVAASVLIGLAVMLRGDGDRIRPAAGTIIAEPSAEGSTSAAQGPSPTSIEPVSAGASAGRGLGHGLRVSPRTHHGRITGFIIASSSKVAVLDGAGLQAGDVLLEVDGNPLDDRRIDGLGDELSTLDRVEIMFERHGRVLKRTIELKPS